MTFWVIVGDILCAAGGGAIVWFFKEPIQKAWYGSERMAARLRARAEAIAAAIKR